MKESLFTRTLHQFWRSATGSNLGRVIIFSWIAISVLLTWLMFYLITPLDVDLGDFECSRATYGECLDYVIKPRAAHEISADLTDKLVDIRKLSAILRLPLEIVDFEIVLKDRGSELQLEISEPEYKEPLLDLNLECVFAGKPISLRNNDQSETGELLKLNNLNEDNIGKISETTANKFGGCDWVPKENFQVSLQTPREVAPGGTISIRKAMKPYLGFRIDFWEKFSIFLGLFALIGGLLALVKQALHLYRKGYLYFVGD